MQLNEVMTAKVDVVNPATKLQDAAQKMRDQGIGALPVCDGERLVGMVTDRDIVIKIVADGRDVSAATVEQAMSPDVVYCFEDQSVEDAAQAMANNQIRRLPIVNRDKRLVGIVSLGDVSVEGSKEAAGEALEEVSTPVH
ncbi:CBS domain-containing protein [Rhodospirillaceae bacterium SYSU D60014]|uniref:CBS domain-containing protein n=1 Tax=Virgifigura deserti TaxID=2268457 RepID=UPI000E65FC6B